MMLTGTPVFATTGRPKESRGSTTMTFGSLPSPRTNGKSLDAVRVVLDSSQRRAERALHLRLTLAGRVDELAQFLDEQIHAVRLELRRDQRPRHVHTTLDEPESLPN